ncbi:MAG: PhoX family phosphatase [Chromatiales bacterium]|nr:PhoX family phosphatase [Chromatiales bacterium]
MTNRNHQGRPSCEEALPAETRHDAQSLLSVDGGDEPPTNFSNNRPFGAVIGQYYSRRQVLQGSLQAAVAGLFAAGPGAALAASPGRSAQGRARPGFEGELGFEAIPVYNGDEVSVAPGYSAEAFLVVGEPILGPDVGNPAANTVEAFENCSGAEMEQRIGSHHDGMTYFPFGSDPNNHGVICINHEYIDARKLFPASGPNAWVSSGTRPADQIRKGIAAHGVSVVEIKRDKATGKWQITTESGLNRRITAETPMVFSGPVRGSDLVRTKYSPDGTMTRGTINNCANGFTPWGTYLTCEENWASYFAAGTQQDAARRELRRYGVTANSRRYGWDNPEINPLTGLPDEPTASPTNPDPYRRFDATPTGFDATEDYRNEPNCQGWNVEIDPFNPDSTPVKHTALGRYAHEGCVVGVPQEGQPLAFYSGDDAQSQYMYKFVTAGRYSRRTAGSHLLETGTLYAAKFNDDGTGEWLALDINDVRFRAAVDRAVADPRSVWPGGQYDDFDGFRDQADVLVNTRLAADVAGATPMDRPEWATVHPSTGEVYFSCTNNSNRGRDTTTNTRPIPAEADAANPRPASAFGHIIRFRERGNRSAATRFNWEIFVLSGPQDDSLDLQGRPLDDTNIHASADGLWLDDRGILWIETDMGSGQQEAEINRFGNNQMLAANPYTGEIRRFFVGCRGQEVTGWADTPDGRTVFVNLQHPGEASESRPVLASTFPDGPGSGGRGRSCTIVITKNDGGVVGT